MENHEERLHKLAIENKINDTKDLMECNANETDKRVIKLLKSLCLQNLACKVERYVQQKHGQSEPQPPPPHAPFIECHL
jgi:hypothetical protein